MQNICLIYVYSNLICIRMTIRDAQVFYLLRIPEPNSEINQERIVNSRKVITEDMSTGIKAR